MNKSLDKITRTLKGKSSQFRGSSILHNNAVLYTVFAIAVVNFFSYVSSGDIRHSIIFLLTGFVVSFLSKNMVVILCIAMAVTNIVKVATSSREGMEDGEETKEETPEKEEKNKEKHDEDKAVAETMKTIKKDGDELLEVQDKIIDGFNEIEPYMKQAEKLATKIEKTASTLNDKI